MNYSKFEIIDGVGVITLNRPKALNSFTIPMGKEVRISLEECKNNRNIRAVLLTGEGRAFCTGQDLVEATGDDAPSIEDIVEATYNPLIQSIRDIEKPVLCAVNGIAAGAGANIAIACDITYAAESAIFIQSFSNIGLIPDSAGTFFLPRLIGMQRATAHMFFADKMTASKAKEIGMIYEVVPDENLFETVLNVAKSLAVRPTKGFGLTKRALNASFINTVESQLELEKELQAIAGKTYDKKEGIQAFLEKRKPVFKGE